VTETPRSTRLPPGSEAAASDSYVICRNKNCAKPLLLPKGARGLVQCRHCGTIFRVPSLSWRRRAPTLVDRQPPTLNRVFSPRISRPQWIALLLIGLAVAVVAPTGRRFVVSAPPGDQPFRPQSVVAQSTVRDSEPTRTPKPSATVVPQPSPARVEASPAPSIAAPPTPVASRSNDNGTWPPYEERLKTGEIEVQFENALKTPITIGVRRGREGADIIVSAGATRSLWLEPGAGEWLWRANDGSRPVVRNQLMVDKSGRYVVGAGGP